MRRREPPKVLSRLLTPGWCIPGLTVVKERVRTLLSLPLVYRQVEVLIPGYPPRVSRECAHLAQKHGECCPFAPPSDYTLGCGEVRGGFDDDSGGVATFRDSLCTGAFCSGFVCLYPPVSPRVWVIPSLDSLPDYPWVEQFLTFLTVISRTAR